MKNLLLTVALLGMLSCAKEPNFALEEEASLVLDYLQSCSGADNPDKLVAVKLRSEHLENYVLTRGRGMGLTLVGPEEFKKTTGTLYEFEEPYWTEAGTIELPMYIVGSSKIGLSGVFTREKNGFEGHGFMAGNGFTKWTPTSFENEIVE